MRSTYDRLELIRMRIPASRGVEFEVAWPRAVTRALAVILSTTLLSTVILVGGPAARLGWTGSIGIVLLVSLASVLFSYYLERFHASRLQPFDSFNRRWLFAGLLVFMLAIFRIEMALGISEAWMAVAMPAALFGMLLAVVYDQRFAFDNLFLFFGLIVVAWFASRQGKGIDATQLAHFFSSLVAQFIGATVGILMTRELRSRIKLVKVGAYVGAAMATTLVAFQFIELVKHDVNQGALDYLLPLVLVVGHGVLTGIIVTSLIPVVEQTFGVVTEIRLMELEDGNHPLLRMMLERAPGTYMHTQNVARIASAAVEAIGGNALLSRVGTLFHDLGKMVRPEYFTENEPNSKFFHDRLSPAMSGLIIISHVKEGVVLARQHKLPKILEDFITGHHGTSCVSYFYRMAKMQAREGERIEESQFRYPGPKPQSKESAIVAIADLVEASARAKLQGPQTPASLQKFVHDAIMVKLNDGQFEECDITLRDLSIAEESIIKTLASMYHHRVKYPDDPDARKRKLAILEKEEYRRERAKQREKILTQ